MDSKKTILCAVLLAGHLLAADPKGVPWMDMDKPQAFCERRVALDVSTDYFYEISNPLPGQTEYNALISLYRKRYWGELDRAIAVFVKTFERSPLREAVAFLDAQSKFDRATDDASARDAEKAMRDALLLYPSSKLAPVICASHANFWLRRGNFERALSMYRNSLVTYADTPPACIFKMGIAETSFQLHDWATAARSLREVQESCRNTPLRAAAAIRAAELPMVTEKPGSEAALEKLLESDGGFVERFHQSALFNVGELKYRAASYDEAKFYFNQYLRNVPKDGTCVPAALKRMADIAYRQHDSLPTVAAKYLEVHEAAPNADIGRFAYAHALLLTLDDVKRPELNRRIKVIDETADAIADRDIRERVFLEKGLASLQWGEPGALGYLTHLRKQKPEALDGALGEFVRQRVRSLTEQDFQRPEEDGDALGNLEERYADWLRSSADDRWARDFYARELTGQVEKRLAKSDRDGALALLERWRTHGLWQEKGPEEKLRQRLAVALLRGLVAPETESSNSRQTAALYVEKAATLKPFFEGALAVVPALIAHAAGDGQPLQPYLTGKTALPKGLPASLSDLIHLAFAQSQHKEKKLAAAERTLASVTDREWQLAKLTELSATLRDAGRFDRAYPVAIKRFGLLKPAERPAALTEIGHLVRDGKLWSKASEVRRLAEKNGIAGKELAPFYYLSGRADFEKATCDAAVKAYQRGIELDPDAPEIPEARFRLGKCLARSRKTVAAREEYEQLVKMQDSFWSPLARNELKLLSK